MSRYPVRVALALGAVLLGLVSPAAVGTTAWAAKPATAPALATAPDSAAVPGLTAPNCVASLVIVAQWSTGFVAQVTLRNVGQTTWNGWQAVLRLPSTYRITQIWNVSVTQIGDVIVVTGSDRVPPGGAVGFGFAAAGSGPAGPISVTCTGL